MRTFPFPSNRKARGRLLSITVIKFLFMAHSVDSDKSEIKQLKCTFYLNKKCNLEVTSIITIVLPFYKLQEGLAPCMLRGTFLEHYFCQYVILQLCSNYVTKCPCSIPSLLHIHCIQCTYINLIVTVMVIQVDNDWSFVDPFFAYFFEWTRLLSARNDRTFLV